MVKLDVDVEVKEHDKSIALFITAKHIKTLMK